MAKAKSNEPVEVPIGADVRPFEKAMDDLQRSMGRRFKSDVGRFTGNAFSVGTGGALGVLSADAVLDNQLAESYEASQVLQPGSENAAGTLRNIRQGFARHAIDINPSELAHTFRSAADTMLTGKGDVEQMGEILTYSGLPTDKESLRYMQEYPINALAYYLKGGAQSKYKETHPGLYRWALDQLGMTEVHQTFDTLGVGMGVRLQMNEEAAGTFEGARSAYWTKLGAHGVGVDLTRGSHRVGGHLANKYEDFAHKVEAFVDEMKRLATPETWKNALIEEVNEYYAPYGKHLNDQWKGVTKPNE